MNDWAMARSLAVHGRLDGEPHHVPYDDEHHRNAEHLASLGLALDQPDDAEDAANAGAENRHQPLGDRQVRVRGLAPAFLFELSQTGVEDLATEAALGGSFRDHLAARGARLA